MATHRYNILTWKDPAGQYTASFVDTPVGAAIGATAAEASDQLLEYLRWIYRRQPWTEQPDFRDAELTTIAVEVRPEYRAGPRVFPSTRTIRLAVPCVLGQRSAAVRACVMPTMGQTFHYTNAREVKTLVTQYVQQKLSGMTPRAVARFAPPAELVLGQLVVRAKESERPPEQVTRVQTLELVATPLDGRRDAGKGGAGPGHPGAIPGASARAWERDRELGDLVRRLGQERTSMVLMGESGTGKSTLLRDAVRRIRAAGNPAGRADEAPRMSAPYRFWLTSAARLIAGMKYLGQWQARCERVIDELSAVDGVLCVENLLDLVQVGGQGPGDSVGAFLLPYIQRAELRLVGEATPSEMDACRRLLPALGDAMAVLRVEPFSRTQALAVLERVSENLTQNLGVAIEEGATRQVYRLFHRFMPYQPFPGRPVAFLKDVYDRASRRDDKRVTAQGVVERFTQVTGLPERFLRDDMMLSRERVLSELRDRIIGQEAACQSVGDVVMTFKSAVNDPQRPIGVLLFCGPTGVGKTEMARAVARTFFGAAEKERLIRLDMSEYGGPGAAARLLGDPYGEPSVLIRQVRQQPFVVLLLDEIEKAHREVFDVLLSVLDEGRLTDRFGRLTTFRSAVIIMTSNLAGQAGPAFGFGGGRDVAGERRPSSSTQEPPGAAGGSGDAEASAFFRPEFYNRIDAVMTFEPLSRATVLQITREQLAKVAQREGLVAAKVRLVWNEDLVELVAKEGYDARYGARPLQRALEALVVTPLARYLVAHPRLRDAEVRLAVREGAVVFT